MWRLRLSSDVITEQLVFKEALKEKTASVFVASGILQPPTPTAEREEALWDLFFPESREQRLDPNMRSSVFKPNLNSNLHLLASTERRHVNVNRPIKT